MQQRPIAGRHHESAIAGRSMEVPGELGNSPSTRALPRRSFFLPLSPPFVSFVYARRLCDTRANNARSSKRAYTSDWETGYHRLAKSARDDDSSSCPENVPVKRGIFNLRDDLDNVRWRERQILFKARVENTLIITVDFFLSFFFSYNNTLHFDPFVRLREWNRISSETRAIRKFRLFLSIFPRTFFFYLAISYQSTPWE